MRLLISSLLIIASFNSFAANADKDLYGLLESIDSAECQDKVCSVELGYSTCTQALETIGCMLYFKGSFSTMYVMNDQARGLYESLKGVYEPKCYEGNCVMLIKGVKCEKQKKLLKDQYSCKTVD